MKHFYLTGFAVILLLFPRNSCAQTIMYYYDAAGNRTEKVIDMGKGKSPITAEKSKKTSIETEIEEPVEERAISDETFPDQKIRIYPNPTKGLIRLEIPDNDETETIQIIVQDLNGRMLINRLNEALVTEIDLSLQPDGIYLLKLKKGMKISQWKIIKH
jgi:hypothetical protein